MASNFPIKKLEKVLKEKREKYALEINTMQFGCMYDKEWRSAKLELVNELLTTIQQLKSQKKK